MSRCISLYFGMNEVIPAAYGGWNGELNACVSDARDMSALLAGAGFEARAVFNLDCTEARLRSEIASASQTLVADDIFFFGDSGHGGRAGAWTWSGYTETLCLADGQLADTALLEMWATFKPGVRIICNFDTCHSGGMARVIEEKAPKRYKPLNITSKVSMPGSRDIQIAASIFMMSACTAEETAADGQFNGAFTGALLDCQAQAARDNKILTWDSWGEAVQRYCAKHVPTQHPVISKVGAAADWSIPVAMAPT